jgi:hypothetical protein
VNIGFEMLTWGRGLPAGYLAALEKRLGETEAALHQALSELYTGRVPEDAPAVDVAGKGKSTLMDEWQRLPLGNKNSQYHWWTEKSGTSGSQAVEVDNHEVPRNIEPEPDDDIEDMQSRIAPDHHSSVWESSNAHASEYLRQEDNTVQLMEEVHDVHSSLSSYRTPQRDASLSSRRHQLHEKPFGQPRPPEVAGNINMARAYAAVHDNIYF